jgi:tetratricopeptide (TPR) repeat protein
LATHQLADLVWVVHRPWLGLGAGGAIHEAHRLAGLPQTGAGRWLAEFGWIGTGAWLLVLYTLLRRWCFFARHQEDRTRSLVLGGLGAACAAATAAFVVVPVPSALYAWTAAVTGGAVEYLGNRRPFSRSIPLRQAILVAYGGITVLVVFGFAILVRPAMGEFHRLAGDALLETDPAAAQASYRKAIGWDYRNPAAHAALGRMELDRGALYDARAHLEAAVENDPYRIGALEDLLDCYRRLGGAVPEADRAAIEERVRQLRPSPDANIMPSGSKSPAGGAQ